MKKSGYIASATAAAATAYVLLTNPAQAGEPATPVFEDDEIVCYDKADKPICELPAPKKKKPFKAKDGKGCRGWADGFPGTLSFPVSKGSYKKLEEQIADTEATIRVIPKNAYQADYEERHGKWDDKHSTYGWQVCAELTLPEDQSDKLRDLQSKLTQYDRKTQELEEKLERADENLRKARDKSNRRVPRSIYKRISRQLDVCLKKRGELEEELDDALEILAKKSMGFGLSYRVIGMGGTLFQDIPVELSYENGNFILRTEAGPRFNMSRTSRGPREMTGHSRKVMPDGTEVVRKDWETPITNPDLVSIVMGAYVGGTFEINPELLFDLTTGVRVSVGSQEVSADRERTVSMNGGEEVRHPQGRTDPETELTASIEVPVQVRLRYLLNEDNVLTFQFEGAFSTGNDPVLIGTSIGWQTQF
jgi:hypothetical protein